MLNSRLHQPDAEPDEMDFPECQYVASGLNLETTQQLGDTYRAGDILEPIGDEVAERISNRLNQIQNRRDALDK